MRRVGSDFNAWLKGHGLPCSLLCCQHLAKCPTQSRAQYEWTKKQITNNIIKQINMVFLPPPTFPAPPCSHHITVGCSGCLSPGLIYDPIHWPLQAQLRKPGWQDVVQDPIPCACVFLVGALGGLAFPRQLCLLLSSLARVSGEKDRTGRRPGMILMFLREKAVAAVRAMVSQCWAGAWLHLPPLSRSL